MSANRKPFISQIKSEYEQFEYKVKYEEWMDINLQGNSKKRLYYIHRINRLQCPSSKCSYSLLIFDMKSFRLAHILNDSLRHQNIKGAPYNYHQFYRPSVKRCLNARIKGYSVKNHVARKFA